MPFDAWHGRLNVASIIRCPSARPVPTWRIISIFSFSFFSLAIARRGDIDWSISSKAARLLLFPFFFLQRLFFIPVGYITTIRELERNEGYILILKFWSMVYSFRFLIVRVSFIKSYTLIRRYSMIYAPIDYYSILTRPITFPTIKQEYYSSNYNVFNSKPVVHIYSLNPSINISHKSYI